MIILTVTVLAALVAALASGSVARPVASSLLIAIGLVATLALSSVLPRPISEWVTWDLKRVGIIGKYLDGKATRTLSAFEVVAFGGLVVAMLATAIWILSAFFEVSQ